MFGALRTALEGDCFEEAKQIVNTSNVAERDSDGYGIISYVCEYGPDDPDFLCHFLEKGATLELDSVGIRSSPLHCAAATNKPKLIYKMLDLAIPVNIKSPYYTPLDRTVNYNERWSPNELCAKILMDAGGIQTSSFMPTFMRVYKTKCENVKRSVIVILGLLVCGSRVVMPNGRDVLRIIARCVWATRGDK